MAINISQAFHRTSANPIDDTLALTKAEMLTVNDNLMPNKYLTVCQDDGQVYLYDKSATPSAETGKFSLLEAGGGSIEGSYLKNFGLVMMNPQPTTWKDVYDKFPTIMSNLISSIPDDELWIVSSVTFSAIGDCRLYRNVALRNTSTVPSIDMSRYWVDSTTDTSHWEIRVGITSSQRIYKTREHVNGTSISIEDFKNNTNVWSTTNSYFIVTKYKMVSGNVGHQYSTNEQVVGTWIDGKPLYEKTIVDTMPTITEDTISEKTISLNISVDKIWIKNAVLFDRGSAIEATPIIYSVEQIKVLNWSLTPKNNNSANPNTLMIRAGRGVYSGLPVYITIQYTKTTD